MSPIQIALLIAAILAVWYVAICALVAWARKRSAQSAEEITRAAIAEGEKVILGPEAALYRGGTGGFGRVKGNGEIVLTDRRVIFCKLIGGDVEVLLHKVTSVTQSRWFLWSFRDFRQHLILNLRDGGEVGFIVGDHQAWMNAVRQAVTAAGGTA